METPAAENGTSIDLSCVEMESRKATWTGAAPVMLPGLSVSFRSRVPSIGNLKRISLGEGCLWAVRSSPVAVEYHASGVATSESDYIALLMQVEGSALVSHGLSQSHLREGDICIIDEHMDFGIKSLEICGLAVLKFPRTPILTRLPHLKKHIASVLTQAHPGSAILGDMIVSLVKSAHQVPEERRANLLTAIAQILSASLARGETQKTGSEWRVTSALNFIDLNFLSPELRAETVADAQGISRLRLDQILIKTTGTSITGHVWKRRLDHASADLLDPQYSEKTITEVAFDNGFQDSGHFSRAFKARFGRSPAQWRFKPS